MRALRKLAKVTLAFAVLLAFYLAAPASLLGIRPAYAGEGPDTSAPLPIPEDSMGNRPSGGTAEITYDVDVRDGSLRARVVDIWGPGKKPLVYRSWSARDGWVWNDHLDYQIVDTGSGLAAMVLEPDGNRYKYRYIRECLYASTAQGTQRVRVWAKEIGAYAVLETHDLLVGDPGGGGGGGGGEARPSGGSTSGTRPTPAPTKQPQLGFPDTTRTTSPFPTGLTTVEAARLGGAATMSSTSCSSPWVSNGFGRIAFGKGVTRNYQNAWVTTQQDASGNQVTWTYTTPANADRPYISTIADPVGRVISITYTQGDAICLATDPETGNCTQLRYKQLVSRVTDPYGRQANYTYLSHGTPEGNKRLLVSATSPAATTTSYTYLTGTAYLSRVTNARSFQTTFTWDVSGTCSGAGLPPARISRVIAPDGTFTQYACLVTYSPPNVRVTVTDARGNNTIYNVAWSLTELGDVKDVTNALGRVTRFHYDTRRNLTQLVDAKNTTVTYQYNIRNNRIQKIVAVGSLNLTSSSEWDDFDNLLRVRSPRATQEGFISAEYTYDSAHRVTMLRRAPGQPEQSTIQLAYNAWGGVSAVTDPRGNVTQYTYNARRLLQTIVPPVGGITTYTYDANEDTIAKTDGNGRNWQVVYDVRRNPIRAADPLNNQIQLQYDANANLTRVTDARNNSATTTYDNRDRVTTIVDAANGTTAYVYDAVGNTTRVTNARNAATQLAYNQLNQLTQLTDALGQNTVHTYDEVGNLLTTRDRKNQLFTITHDQAYRLAQISVGGQTIQYTYDRNGNRLTMVDATGTTQYTYDKLGRRTQLTYPDGSLFQVTFDAAGNRTSFTNSKGVVTTYTYNAANWLTGMTQGTLTWTFSYDAAGNRTQLNQPNGITTNYAYLNNNWLQSLTHRRSSTTLQSFVYAYDANGNRITQTDATGTASFTYDVLNRLTGAIYGGGTGTGTWSYDAVGNRVQQILPGNSVTNYTYDLNNRLTQAGTTTYNYDANGNMTSRSSGGTFVYDAWNRMTQATVGGNTVNYTYNGDGVKVRRSGHGAPPGGYENYYHVGGREVLRTDPAGTVITQHDRDIFGNLLARRGPGVAYYHAFDGVGSTTGVTDAAGTVLATMLYDAWGNVRQQTGSLFFRYRFTGAEIDPTTNLYHMGARFYDPTIARWLSEDPVQGNYFSPGSLNYYAYVLNDPLTKVDPSGKYWEPGPGGGYNIEGPPSLGPTSPAPCLCYGDPEPKPPADGPPDAPSYSGGVGDGGDDGAGDPEMNANDDRNIPNPIFVSSLSFAVSWITREAISRYGILTIRAAQAITAGHNHRIEAAHIIAARHAPLLGVHPDDMPGLVLRFAEHRKMFDNLYNRIVGDPSSRTQLIDRVNTFLRDHVNMTADEIRKVWDMIDQARRR